MSSIQPRKQRKALHNSPLHLRGRRMHAHLSEELLVKFGKRSTSVRVGDTAKVLRGSHAGTTGEVLEVDRSRFTITMQGVTVKKADGKEKPKPIHPSDVVLTKLVLTDKLRREKLGASEADAEAAKPAKPKAAKPGKPEPAQPTQAERQEAKAKAKAEPEAEDLDLDEEETR